VGVAEQLYFARVPLTAPADVMPHVHVVPDPWALDGLDGAVRNPLPSKRRACADALRAWG
jgi:hypothetical protein